MPTLVLVLLSVVIGTYLLQVGAAAVGYARIRRQPEPSAPAEWPFASVIVPARNEADDIEACLTSLRNCSYPDDRYEIIVVDDFSTDGTAARVKANQPAGVKPSGDDPVRLVEMAAQTGSNGGHKPEAVAHGVEAANGDVILTTDADCTVSANWLRSMVSRCTPDTPFVAGPVAYEHEDLFFGRLQALQLTGLVAYGAGTIGLGLPTFCNSANVAYRQEILSGRRATTNGAAQDELLLQHVAYDTDRAVTFNLDPDALVTTAPAPDFLSYVRQQARWAHMGLRYPFQIPRILVVGLWLAHTALFATGLAALFLPAWRQPLLLALLAKMGVDAALTVPAARRTGQRGLLRSTVPTELLLLIIVPIVGLLGSYAPPEWKGRPIE